MATYKISDLHNRLCEMSADGYEYVDITSLSADDDSPECLCFEAVQDSCGLVDYETVDSCELPEDYDIETSSHKFVLTDYCSEISFTYQEIVSIRYAVESALKYSKTILDNPSESAEAKRRVKQESVALRNLQAKLLKFFKCIV